MNQFQKSIVLWLVLGLMFLLLFNFFSREPTPRPEIIFSDFLNQVEKSQVAGVTIQGDLIYGRTTRGEHFKTYAPRGADLLNTLRAKGVKIAAKPPSETDPWLILAVVFAAFSIIFAVMFFFVIILWRRNLEVLRRNLEALRGMQEQIKALRSEPPRTQPET